MLSTNPILRRRLIMLAITAALVAGPVPVGAHGPLTSATTTRAHSADLAPALAVDGTFRGSPGLAGSVDTSTWALVSDLTTGEAPRFAPAASSVSPATATPAGPWSALGNGLGFEVRAIAVSGSDLYVGGGFENAAGIATADYVVKWNGSAWSALGSNGHGDGAINGYEVYALTVSGSDLYVGGDFQNVAGIATADYVAKWNGSVWSALGSNGTGDGAINIPVGGLGEYRGVYALAVSGANLYAGGTFKNAAGIPEADGIAMWNGDGWSALGQSVNDPGNGAITGVVFALAVSSNGAILYVGGSFENAASILAADSIATWSGGAWSALGSTGTDPEDGALHDPYASFPIVQALAVAGSNLYVAGWFQADDPSGNPIPGALNIARWNGSWSALTSAPVFYDGPYALAVSGSDLYVGGHFTDAASVATADYIAKWNGSTFSGLGSNGSGDGAITGDVFALAVSSDGLYLGGQFANVAGIAAADGIVKWGTVVRPSVTAPVAALASGVMLGTSTVPVRLAWTGSDTGSGIGHYQVALSTNGGAYVLVASPTTTAYTRSFASSTITTYRFRVRAFDLAGNASGWVSGPIFHVRLIQQSSLAVHYAGTWTTGSSIYASGGSYRYTRATGASVSYTFTGRTVAVVAHKGTTLGSVRVYIDGVYRATVSDYATSTLWRRVVYVRNWTTSGSHTIKLVCVGTAGHPRIDLDAFVVLG